MTITLSPETEAKLIRFANSRGLSPEDALEKLLDAAELDMRKALDDFRAREKAAWRTREEKLIARAREARLLREQETAA